MEKLTDLSSLSNNAKDALLTSAVRRDTTIAPARGRTGETEENEPKLKRVAL